MENKGGGERHIKLKCVFLRFPFLKNKILTSVLTILFLFISVTPALATNLWGPANNNLVLGVNGSNFVQQNLIYAGKFQWKLFKNGTLFASGPANYNYNWSAGYTCVITGGYSPGYQWMLEYVDSNNNILFGPAYYPADSPSIPTGLSINNGTLTWTPNPSIDDISYYTVYQDGVQVSTTSSTSYSFSGLTVGNHTFALSATNPNSTSALSTTVTATVYPINPSPIVSNITSSSADITWTSIPGATSYDISINGSLAANVIMPSYNMTGLLYCTNYSVSVVAKSSVGDSSPGTTSFTTANIPSPPTGLQATNITTSSIDLSWIAVSGATSYILDQNNNILATTTNTFYHCTGLTPNTTYDYKVAVTTSSGESNYSNPVSVTTLGLPPSTPTGLSVGNITSKSYTLYWIRQSDASSYNIYLDGTLAGNVAQPLLFNPSFDFNNLTAGSTHVMSVIAINQWGDSSASQQLNVILLPAAPVLNYSNITSNSLDLSWGNSNGATDYYIYQNGKQITDLSALTYHVTNLNPNASYNYQIAAANSTGLSQLSNTINVTTLKVPLNPVLKSTVDNNNIQLSWSGDGDSYDIMVNGNQIDQVTNNSYTLTEKPGTYQIQIIQDYNGQQYPSNILTAMVSAFQNAGAAQMTGDILSNVGEVIAPVGGLLALVLAIKGSPMLIATAKAFFLKI